MTDHFMPITTAAEMYPQLDLYSLVQSGTIKSAMLTTISNFPGVVLVSDEDILNNLPREARPDYQQFRDLRGVHIGIREAGRKYHVLSQTISRWVKRGLITSYGKESVRGGYKIMIDEADIAYCASIHAQRPGQGYRLFPPIDKPNK